MCEEEKYKNLSLNMKITDQQCITGMRKWEPFVFTGSTILGWKCISRTGTTQGMNYFGSKLMWKTLKVETLSIIYLYVLLF